MKRRGLLWGLALGAVMVGCAPRAPRKPAGVAPEAFWVGNRHGGVFVVIGPKDRDGWRIRIADDHTGAARADGLFNLRGIARAEIAPEDITAYDGTALHLADGATLVPKRKP